MIKTSRALIFLVLVCLIALNPTKAGSRFGSPVFLSGEELVYEVSFLGVKLGTIRLITEDTDIVNNHITYRTVCIVDTYDNIPFVAFHASFKSWIDTSGACSYKLISNWNEKNTEYDVADFLYESSTINFSGWKNHKNIFNRTISSSRRYNDGSSIFYFARRFAASHRNIKVPTIMNQDTASTRMYFSGRKEKVDIKAVGYPVSTIFVNGYADWKGVYGMNGYFEGWFSDDEARVPVKARMNVSIGYIDVELVKWKRAGWKPPG